MVSDGAFALFLVVPKMFDKRPILFKGADGAFALGGGGLGGAGFLWFTIASTDAEAVLR